MPEKIITGIIFKKVFDELFSYLKTKSSSFARHGKIDVDDSYLKASKVEDVKTIWQVDRRVNLNEFYYPSKIQIENSRTEIGSLNDLPENGKLVIQGTAGQGKSIFLRYLTGQELKHGTTIPIFIELRKITERQNIELLIIEAIKELGIDCDTSTVNFILGSGKCTLLFDAFDEIKADQVTDAITYIEGLCAKYKHSVSCVV